MEIVTETWIALAGGMLVGGGVVAAIMASRQKASEVKWAVQAEAEMKRGEEKQVELEQARSQIQTLTTEKEKVVQSEVSLQVKLEAEQKAAEEKQALLEKAQEKLGDAFKALSAEALKASQEQFLQLAQTSLKVQQEKATGDLEKRRDAVERMIKPMADSLDKVQGRLGEIEKAREGAYSSIKQQVQQMAETQLGLQKETAQLVKALRQPTGRGQWGEMQLRRVVEMAGMQEHCDFETQTTTTTDEGKRLRPDLIVNLPGGQHIVVDSKAPMDAYLDAVEGDDDTVRDAALARHANQVRTHIQQLASKKYQDQFEASPEFVVLFLPSEAFFSAALAQDSSLIEKGVDQGVILATPTTLIALLRAVAYGWRQEALAQNAREISSVGNELYTRLAKFAGDVEKMGKSLSTTVNHYNAAVGSLDSRVLSSARKFEALGASPEQTTLPQPAPVEKVVREVKTAADLPKEQAAKEIPTAAAEGTGFIDFASSGLEADFEGFMATGDEGGSVIQ